MQKTLHLTPSYLPKRGGVEIHVHEISKRLKKRGYDTTVLSFAQIKSIKKKREDGVSVIRLPRPKTENKFLYKLKIWKVIWSQKELFKSQDVIHVHDVFWMILPMLALIRKKVFLTHHGWEGKYPVPFFTKLQRYLFAKLSRGLIHVGDYIREFYWERPDTVVYGGYEKARNQHAMAAMPWNSKSRKSKIEVVFVGRLEEVNEVGGYVELISRLRSKNKNVEVFWVGDGSYRKKCEKFGRVTGMVEDTAKYIRNADIVFANSYLSILEAQKMGRPVVALYSTKVKQRYLESWPAAEGMVIGNAGSKKIMNEIQELIINNKKRQSIGKNAKQLTKKLTWEKVTDNYEKLWQEKLH